MMTLSTTLSSSDRSQLEKAVLAARGVAERAVGKRFAGLALSAAVVPDGLSADDRALRNGLRKRARDLGRGRVNADLDNLGAIEAGAPFLIEELAYDAWHRMLFARFLAENELLMHPEYGVTLSLGDVRELAAESGEDPWDLAASFAGDRLPGLFHLNVPLRLASEDRQDLARILGGLDASLFTATDALGWVYQFWQAKRKDEVNAAGEKITGNNLPAVTQLFTEDYIVDFLLQNSLGAWYASRYPDTNLKANWPYLRYRDDGTPAAGTFPTWPDDVRSVTVMDPCCGSGHFLVAAYHMLVAMRREVEGLSAPEAADAVLRDNLFGLELDARCTQIAIFAVALEAWKLGGHPEANLPHIACSGIPVSGQIDAWVRLAGKDTNMEVALTQLYDLFAQAPELGSLIDPKRAALLGGTTKRGQTGFALQHEWATVERKLHQALAKERTSDPASAIFADDDLVGTIRAAQLLSRTYTLVATNVPYLSRGSHDAALREFAADYYSEAKNDLATIFLERCLGFVASIDDARGNPSGAGTVAAVTPQNWLFLGAYKKLRQTMLERDSIDLIARLGTGAFRTISGEVVNVALPILTAAPPSFDHVFASIDVSHASFPDAKAALLQFGYLSIVFQLKQLKNPNAVLSTEEIGTGPMFSAIAATAGGMCTFDNSRFIYDFWEVVSDETVWPKLQTTVKDSQPFGGRSRVVRWEEGRGQFFQFVQAMRKGGYTSGIWKAGQQIWGKRGVLVSLMGALPSTLYDGKPFDNNTGVIVPKNPEHLPAIWAFCSSPEFNSAVRKIDSALKVTNASLVKVPFDLERWQKVADELYPDGLPEPYSSDPTQWLFDGTVPGSDHPLHVAMARLLGYRWPDQVDDGLDALADPDGIVCLPSIYQEAPAHQRLLDLLRTAYGDAWSPDLLRDLLKQVEATSLESWLRDKKGFFAQHVRLFHNRPFLWQITDGRKDGFSAVVNYHRLDARALSKLIHTYLGDWISRQQRAVEAGEAGAPARLEAATALRAKLMAIADGETPFDIYVRWKSMAEQPIGWNPDLNDGVRLNIRPFIQAGVLASKVTVNWNKDRGKDPEIRTEPLTAEANGNQDLRKRLELHCSVDRHNDLHFTRAEKERARELSPRPEPEA